MDHLNKQQVTLLCLLIALFTSITTSIITATIMDKSSSGVGQTIYKVVERTIQEVAPKPANVAKIVEKEKPKEPEQIPLDQIVEKANQSMVSIWSKNNRGDKTYVSSGAILGGKNEVIAFSGFQIFVKPVYIIKLADGKELEMKRQEVKLPEGLALLSYSTDAKEKPQLPGLSLGHLSSEKLAANVIALGAKEQGNVVSTGIITEFPLPNATATSTDKSIAITDIRPSLPASSWLLLNTSGNVIGFLSGAVEGDKGARYFDVEKIISLSPNSF